MDCKKTIIVRSPKEDSECLYCDNRGNCKEKFEIASPIIFDGKAIGLIAIIATSEQQRQFLMDKEKSFIKYIEKMASLLASHIMELRFKNEVELKNKELNVVINNITNAVICISKDGRIKYINNKALEMLGKKKLNESQYIKDIWPNSLLEKAMSLPEQDEEIKDQEIIIKDNKENLISSHITRIYEDGELSSIVGTFIDSDLIQKTAAKLGNLLRIQILIIYSVIHLIMWR